MVTCSLLSIGKSSGCVIMGVVLPADMLARSNFWSAVSKAFLSMSLDAPTIFIL
jgi:hypothetical protein